MSFNSCPHVDIYKSEGAIDQYRYICAYFTTCIAKHSRQKKVLYCVCHECKTNGNRLHACLYCAYLGCFKRGHVQKHIDETGHTLAMDTTHGHIYCSICKDYVYDNDLELILKNDLLVAGKISGKHMYFPWKPCSVSQIAEIKQNDIRHKILDRSYLGLRGLVNLGQTCFMNCIVQVLVHTPLLRDYFLSERHVCHFEDSPFSPCLVCEMASLFQEFYSGKSMAHIPGKLVYLIWNHAKHLAGFEQQDAHEFFSSILDILHLHSIGKTTSDTNNNCHDCNCIIDQVFTGFLQSDVVCLNCNAVSTKIDPIQHISLDLGETESSGSTPDQPISLSDCLHRYTQPEHIDLTCENCEMHQKSKQLTMKKLPVVTTFHLKRSDIEVKENKKRVQETKNIHRKNSTFIEFPEFLDLTPYMSSIRCTRPSTEGLYGSENRFCLFAVVNHSGNQEGGHYVSFIRHHKKMWFKCDDDIITKANISDVLLSEGYLLFYHKECIEYEEKVNGVLS